MNPNSFSSLSHFLETNPAPKTRAHFGFLELINKASHENINSQVYRHFLSCPYEEIRAAFLEALLELVEEKTSKKIALFHPSVQSEVTTKKGNRIDLAIEDFANQSAIIIENKIYHHANNDFLDYWKHFEKLDENKRAGVLLTLEKSGLNNNVKDYFVNITHQEWVARVQTKLELDALPTNYQVYLNDFFNTIDNLTKSYTMNEAAKFYFEHAEKVNQVAQTKEEAYKYVNNQLARVAGELGLEMYGNSVEWRNFWDQSNQLEVYLTVFTHDLLKGKKRIGIAIELFRDKIKRLNELDIHLKNHTQYHDKNKGEVAKNHAHYLIKYYDLSEVQLENLAETIVCFIRQDFAELTISAIKFIYPEVDIKRWEKQFLGE